MEHITSVPKFKEVKNVTASDVGQTNFRASKGSEAMFTNQNEISSNRIN